MPSAGHGLHRGFAQRQRQGPCLRRTADDEPDWNPALRPPGDDDQWDEPQELRGAVTVFTAMKDDFKGQ